MAPLTSTADMFNNNPAAQLTIASIHNLTGDQSVMIGDASFNLSSWDTRCSRRERDGGLGTHQHYLETIVQPLNACYGNRRLKTHFINNLENAEEETEAKRGRNRHSISGKGMNVTEEGKTALLESMRYETSLCLVSAPRLHRRNW